ncbi:MAG: hypothetical protein EBX41_10500 [Chitinophagia bacterium]|nr:hypothetical protein [Chitinophagia bacterium]
METKLTILTGLFTAIIILAIVVMRLWAALHAKQFANYIAAHYTPIFCLHNGETVYVKNTAKHASTQYTTTEIYARWKKAKQPTKTK